MIEQLASQLFQDIRSKVSQLESSSGLSSSKLKAILEANLRKLNLVTREEFDAQVSVLKRTREKVQQLEAQIKELEEQVKGG